MRAAKNTRTYPYANARIFGISIGLKHKHRREAPERAAVIMGFHPGRASEGRAGAAAAPMRIRCWWRRRGRAPGEAGAGGRFSRFCRRAEEVFGRVWNGRDGGGAAGAGRGAFLPCCSCPRGAGCRPRRFVILYIPDHEAAASWVGERPVSDRMVVTGIAPGQKGCGGCFICPPTLSWIIGANLRRRRVRQTAAVAWQSRKVRTPQDRELGNAQAGRPDGKCRRNQTADGPKGHRQG